ASRSVCLGPCRFHHPSVPPPLPSGRYHPCPVSFFFFNDPAPTEIYTLSLHDALPISTQTTDPRPAAASSRAARRAASSGSRGTRSEEHTSELQSLTNLVCRLLLEKKKK